jgi:hypothetical protein
MLERTDAIKNEFLEQVVFVLTYRSVFSVYLRLLAEQAIERIFSKSSSVVIGYVSLQQPLD